MTSRVGNHIALCALIGLLLLWALTLRPQVLGGSALYVVVRGNSMLPTYDTGDLLVVQPAADYAVGDVVAYRVPDGELGEGRIVIHRIVGGDVANGLVLKGDNNPAPDPWSPRAGDVVGKPWVAVPTLGRVIAWLHQPVVAGGLAASVMVTWLLARRPKGGRRRPEGWRGSGVVWRGPNANSSVLHDRLTAVVTESGALTSSSSAARPARPRQRSRPSPRTR